MSALELEAARRDLQSATSAIAAFPVGLVKRRLEAELKEIGDEIQSQLWRHLQNSSKQMNASTPTVGEAQEKQQQRQTQTTARGAGFGGGGSGGPLSPTGAVLHKVKEIDLLVG